MFVNNYDRVIGVTSLYILIPFFYAPRLEQFFLLALTGVSLFHWSDYENKIYHVADNITATFVFSWYVLKCWLYPNGYCLLSSCCALLSILAFICRRNTRNLALESNNIVYIIPHALFRFFSFWFVMFVYGVYYSWTLTILYWLTVLFLYQF